MWLDLKRTLRRLTPVEVAARELVDAQLAELEALSAQEYAKALATYNADRVQRLQKFLASQRKVAAVELEKGVKA